MDISFVITPSRILIRKLFLPVNNIPKCISWGICRDSIRKAYILILSAKVGLSKTKFIFKTRNSKSSALDLEKSLEGSTVFLCIWIQAGKSSSPLLCIQPCSALTDRIQWVNLGAEPTLTKCLQNEY